MSSLIQRLGIRRESQTRREQTSRDPFGETESSAARKNAPPSFVSIIIKDKVNDPDNMVHQRKMALNSAVGYNIVVKLSQNTFDDGFEFVDEKGNTIDAMIPVQQKLRSLNAIFYLTMNIILERMYGYGWMYLVRENGAIIALDFLSPEITEVKEFDKNGNPSLLEVTVVKADKAAKKEAKKIEVKIADTIHFRTRPWPHERSYTGMPVLYPAWTPIISIEQTLHSSDFYLAKIGYGAYTVTTTSKATQTNIDAIEKMMIRGSVTRVNILPGKYVEDIKFINAEGTPTNFMQEVDTRLSLIAAATGVPKDTIIGLSAGSITGSEVNVKALYQTLNQIQTSCKPYIRDLVRELGYTDEDYFIRFIRRYAHDEEQQAKIRMNEAQTLVMSSWMTSNEKREVMGLEGLPGGDVLKSDFNMGVEVSGFQTPEEQDKTNNPEGDN